MSNSANLTEEQLEEYKVAFAIFDQDCSGLNCYTALDGNIMKFIFYLYRILIFDKLW